MSYDIHIGAETTCGQKLRTVMLRNAPEDADKIIRIRESLLTDGWIGRPVILIDAGDHHVALSGSHRLAASQGLDGVIEAVMLPDDLTADEYVIIDGANDDEDLLAAFVEISQDRDDMDAVIEAMRAELAALGEA